VAFSVDIGTFGVDDICGVQAVFVHKLGNACCKAPDSGGASPVSAASAASAGRVAPAAAADAALATRRRGAASHDISTLADRAARSRMQNWTVQLCQSFGLSSAAILALTAGPLDLCRMPHLAATGLACQDWPGNKNNLLLLGGCLVLGGSAVAGCWEQRLATAD